MFRDAVDASSNQRLGPGARILITRTFLEVVQPTPALRESRSWPQFPEGCEEIYYLESLQETGPQSATAPIIPTTQQMQEPEPDHVEPASHPPLLWHDELGLHADHPFWELAPKLMIRNLPARCLYDELEPGLELLLCRDISQGCATYWALAADPKE